MAVRYECDDCGELIEQLRITETQEGQEGGHDRCLSCLLLHVAELAETKFSLSFVNPTLETMEADGKVC